MRPEDLADGRRGDAVSEPAQLAWMRTTPQVWFSPASRRISLTSSSLIGGRPVGRG
jgi:hypothetical protein